MITKTERAELRSIVRQQFKVLRSEVEQRRLEVIADAEAQIAARYSDEDAAWAQASADAEAIAHEANVKINVLYRKLRPEHPETLLVVARLPDQPKAERRQLERAAHADIDARVHSALLGLARREADLLRNLAVGALESEAANAFLGSIPTVGQLVPAARLAELEAGLGL